MAAIRSMAVALLVLCSIGAAAAAEDKARKSDKAENDAQKRVFAVFGDWGRAGGEGANNFKPHNYDPRRNNACPAKPTDPFYISIDPKIDPSGGPYDKFPDDKCVVNTCGKLTGDQRENCEGKIQQLQSAYHLDKTCDTRGCEFIINTSDNFYALGCNNTDNTSGGNCASRFKTDWEGVYKTSHTPAIKNLKWYSSLGNHDVLGGIAGVEAQIAYSQQHKDWILPARWYATTIGSGPTAINLVVAHTSVFIDGYLTPSSSYSVIDEEQAYSTPAKRAEQLAFLDVAMAAAAKKEGWFVVMGHHPGFSGDQSYFQDDMTGKAESSAWAQFAALVKKYKPVAFVNGHDHCIDFSSPPNYATQFYTSGAGSFTEPNDGGWDKTTGKVRPYKKVLKYSNVRMRDGASFTGNIIMTATPKTFKAEMFSIRSGVKSEYQVTCRKGRSLRYSKPFTCNYGPGEVQPTYAKK